jgi:hypothetical protein
MPAMRSGHHAIGGNTRLIAFFVCLSGLSFTLASRSPQSPFSSAMNLGHVSMREPPRRPRFSLHPTGSSGCPLTSWQFAVCLDLRYEPALPILQLVRWWLVNFPSPVESAPAAALFFVCVHPILALLPLLLLTPFILRILTFTCFYHHCCSCLDCNSTSSAALRFDTSPQLGQQRPPSLPGRFSPDVREK